MSERKQLNLRMDDQGELLEAVKARAKEERITVKEFVIAAIQNALQQPLTSQPTQTSQNDLQIELMEELHSRDERLDNLEQLVAVLAGAIARLSESATPPHSQLPNPDLPYPDEHTDKEISRMTVWKQWETVCTDTIQDLRWEV
ncbi:MAG: hypothetical protein H0X31_10800 [Nostocaceae cyanobacterium]|nr:hypothetical protein [Nostocaceae cyanobacterium]